LGVAPPSCDSGTVINIRHCRRHYRRYYGYRHCWTWCRHACSCLASIPPRQPPKPSGKLQISESLSSSSPLSAAAFVA